MLRNSFQYLIQLFEGNDIDNSAGTKKEVKYGSSIKKTRRLAWASSSTKNIYHPVSLIFPPE